jgi:predicted RNA-binding Zn-ribbon protein involved in translation (DUF1610 family)
MFTGENGKRVMQDPLRRADRYRKEAAELSELAENASSTFLRDHYQRALFERGANYMPVPPSITAASVPCPQCGQVTRIKSVEPHPVSEKESHTFECRECGLPRTYTMKLN